MNNKIAFTLAEVLVTLSILGIIAAVTVPSIIRHYQKAITITKLKKAYADINKIMNISVSENGPIHTWTGTPKEKTMKYIIPYFKVNEVLTMNQVKQKSGKFYEISGDEEKWLAILAGYSQTVYNNTVAINLPNGSQIWIPEPSNNIIWFYVDLNGAKKPNTFGKDLFLMVYWREKNAVFMSSYCDGENKLKIRSASELINGTGCGQRYGCNKSQRGMWCGALIEAQGWKITKDYPW